jgi:hypothetical protein
LILSLTSCAADRDEHGFTEQGGVTEPSAATLLAAVPSSRADSIVAVRLVARSLAIALGDSEVRSGLAKALRNSRVAEGKLQVQRYLKAKGVALARRVEQLNRLPSGDLDRALASVEDLELYLPIPADRQKWQGTSDILVSGFIETDAELRQQGTVVAYDTHGNETTIPYNMPSPQPVLVLTNVETQYAADGESPSASAAEDVATSPSTAFFCQGCPPPPPPPPPPDPCASDINATNVYVCKSEIPNVDGYEGLLRGEPEVAMLMFGELPSGTGMAQIGCINEDQTGASHYDQNTDHGAGHALIGSRTAIQNAHAAGKAVLMMVWEDDNGSKCSFQTSSDAKRKIFQFLDAAGVAVSLGWGTCAATGQCQHGPPYWLFWTGVSVSIISEIILGNDDDFIGAVSLPPDSDPFTAPAFLLNKLSPTAATQSTGTITFAVAP